LKDNTDLYRTESLSFANSFQFKHAQCSALLTGDVVTEKTGL